MLDIIFVLIYFLLILIGGVLLLSKCHFKIEGLNIYMTGAIAITAGLIFLFIAID